jgi:anti-sigma factor RsiW
MNTIKQPDREPSDIEALLPWYATDKINGADKARVDKALLNDPELSRRLALVREEIDEVALLNERIPGPSSNALDRIMRGVAAEPRQAPVLKRAKQGLLDWLGGTLQAFSPRTLALAACAAVAVVALQTAMLSGLIGGSDGTAQYGTASAPSQGVTSGSFVMVAFAPTATAADITAFLKRFDSSIVDGPRASGLFRVKLGAKVMSAAELDAVLAAMLQEKAIVTTAASGN